MQRIQGLVHAFEQIARTRMAGVPILNVALRAEAVDFQRHADDEGGPGLLGILITPWFMNLLWLPDAHAPASTPGTSRLRRLGGEALSFIAAEEAGCRFEACSLFSPVFEFADQAAARAVAQAALAHLRQPIQSSRHGSAMAVKDSVRAEPVEAPQPDQAVSPSTSAVRTNTSPQLSRRGLLFGRRPAETTR
ncbi:[NiFe]-hydrogenase assembly chaperone HybE [Azohydromonas caseinilytica]|uniref:[NiFe]-hydrogenase assembly chaperone HybE n=1 Tax=Azohydromonas caseinilytica TaxID=2728836 RepID=A0A848FAF3_9BURK|nr:[NiFe]-hydrogenase assembly chaperone HybE [Azohydromonas caseinilytica]NML15725.1 [NiFe]-hydrogenase assembly chaperone HybE [Azohydromonas caseinilytica]